LRSTVERESKSGITKQSHNLLVLFLKAFDLRRVQCSPRTEDSYDDEEIDQVERTLNEVAIQMVYKLNDATFRPTFIKLSDWVISAPNTKVKPWKLYRRITWYSFLHTFFDTLQVFIILPQILTFKTDVPEVNCNQLFQPYSHSHRRHTHHLANNFQ
jgi:U3 small nucleolar RNA-associated protein 10